MSLINSKEDSAKTNMLMEEGDSSLEPGEVKTPPHGTESVKSRIAEDSNTKCNAPTYVSHSKSASKQETDRCAEKVRAILELDAIKRKEELERKKGEKSDSISLPNKIKKEQKKHKIPNEESTNEDFEENTREKSDESLLKKHRHKKSKYEDRKTCSTHPIAESFESIDNSANYRAYNPFVRNYRTDFRHRGHPFNTHHRPRFPRYRTQYNHGPYNAPTEEANNSTPINSGIIPHSQLMWTKTKPSISYSFNFYERLKDSSNKECSDMNVQKKKKNKKEREGSNKSQSSSKSSRKSSKRKKIRKIRETFQSNPLKSQLISPSHDVDTTRIVKVEGHVNINIVESPKISIKREDISEPAAENGCANPEYSKSMKEHAKVASKAANSSKPLVLDMFASLTPPKQQSPPLALNNSSNPSAKVQMTKLQEIQDRIGKLLEDDDLKLETIQATKEKLLQKSREHTEGTNLKKSLKKNKMSVSPEKNISFTDFKAEEKELEKNSKQNTKDIGIMPKPYSYAIFKEKPFDIFDGTKNDYIKHTKADREYTPDSLHSEGSHIKSTNLVFNKNPKQKQKYNENSKIIRKVSEKLKKPLEDSPRVHTKSVTCPNSGSPDTDDYSDNWENDDDEMELGATFQNINKLEAPKYIKTERLSSSSPSSSIVDSEESDSNSKLESTTPKNSPPQRCMTPKFSYERKESPNVVCRETNDMQLLYNQFIKSVENANIENEHEPIAKASINDDLKYFENELLSTSSASYSSTSSSSSDTSATSSGSSSTTSSSDSASDESNDTDTNQNKDSNATSNDQKDRSSSVMEVEKAGPLTTPTDDSKPNVAKDLKRLENLEANLLRIQMMRANYDSADEISDELLKMEKLFLHEKNIILNKLMDSSAKKSIKVEKDNESDLVTPAEKDAMESLQSATRGQFVQSLQKLQNKEEEKIEVSNIFDTNREVIKLTISPIKLPKISAIFEADNDTETSKKLMDTSEKANSTVKLPKPTKEVAIVKPIMESKGSPSSHHQKQRRRSPISSHHTLQSKSRSRRGRVRSLSVSPSRNSSGRMVSPQRRGGFSKQSRNRNFDRRSRSRSPSFNRQLNRRSGDLSPISRKRRSLLSAEDRFRKHSPRRDSHSRSRSPSSPPSRHRDRYSRSPLPFKPPSPPTDPNLSPNGSRQNSLSPERRSRSTSRSPSKRTISPSRKSYDSHRHRSLSPKHQHYKPHSPRQSNTSYYFNSSPNRISLDARINIVLNGPSSNHNETNNSITTYEDYSHYGQYGPAAYMSLPSDSNSFYPTNQYVPMSNSVTSVPLGPAIHHNTYSNLRPINTDEPEMYSSGHHQANLNAANFYYNRFGTQPFGFNQPSPVLKELPKATVAVQKGNVLEIVPCSDLLTGNISEHTQGGNENQIKNEGSKEKLVDETTNSNADKNNRSILKPLDGESNVLNSVTVSALKKKKVNFEDGVFPNHNSDDEDRKVIEAKIRVKMRRLKKRLGITPQCHNLFEDKARKERQKVNSNKKPPPPPPIGFAPPNLEQPIYLRTHTPTPLLYFHFDGVVHSMYVSQMERPIPPRLLNPKCLSSSNVGGVASQHTDSQSPLYMQSPITAGAAHLHTSKKDPIATFTRPNRSENLSPKVIPTTATALQQTGSPKINFKIYSPIENIHHTEVGSTTLPGTSPSNIKGNAIHTISSVPIQSHLVQKRQDSPKDAVNTRPNISMGLLPTPLTLPPMPQSTSITAQTRIPVIGVPPTVIPKMIPNVVSEPYMSGFTPTMLQTTQHQVNTINQNYMVAPTIPHTNPHMPVGMQPYFNPPVQRMHRPLPNYMGQPNQPTLSPSNMPMCHIADSLETTNGDLDKFANPQTMPIPYNFKGP
ncbi:uncharacterized protein LOC101453514 isoform X3 [Ceratitis capitata]|uniref:Uncharacterized protein n=1 Tax=Ceratitis capitata TaxID=7213 RepID=W8BWM2_CERCA|nr:uncharacterized protein LOC101453514 isoform X3 [Ceratitis capitata]